VLLHHSGRRSGREYVNPVMYLAHETEPDVIYVFASRAGAPVNPDWYYNLVANPHARIEVGTDTIDVTARVTRDDEREPIWAAQKAAYPGFAGYEQKTSRQIPVVLLTRAG